MVLIAARWIILMVLIDQVNSIRLPIWVLPRLYVTLVIVVILLRVKQLIEIEILKQFIDFLPGLFPFLILRLFLLIVALLLLILRIWIIRVINFSFLHRTVIVIVLKLLLVISKWTVLSLFPLFVLAVVDISWVIFTFNLTLFFVRRLLFRWRRKVIWLRICIFEKFFVLDCFKVWGQHRVLVCWVFGFWWARRIYINRVFFNVFEDDKGLVWLFVISFFEVLIYATKVGSRMVIWVAWEMVCLIIGTFEVLLISF